MYLTPNYNYYRCPKLIEELPNIVIDFSACLSASLWLCVNSNIIKNDKMMTKSDTSVNEI